MADCSKAILGDKVCAADNCCSKYTIISANEADYGGFTAPWIGGEIKAGVEGYFCQPTAAVEAKPFNDKGEIDNYADLKTLWDAAPEYLNGLLPEDEQVDLADDDAFDQWIVARGSTVDDQKSMIMTIVCDKAAYLAAGFAAVLGVASQML